MSDTWYYAELDKPVGPISIVELKRFLHRLKDWKDRLVWHSSFSDWCKADPCPSLELKQTCYGTMRFAASACASMEMARNHLFSSTVLVAASGLSELVGPPSGR